LPQYWDTRKAPPAGKGIKSVAECVRRRHDSGEWRRYVRNYTHPITKEPVCTAITEDELFAAIDGTITDARVEKFVRKEIDDIEEGRKSASKALLSTVATTWLSQRTNDLSKDDREVGYLLTYLARPWKDVTMRRCDEEWVKGYLAALQSKEKGVYVSTRPLAANSIHSAWGTLKLILDDAVENKQLPYNPCMRIKNPPKRGSAEKGTARASTVLTAEQMLQAIEHLKDMGKHAGHRTSAHLGISTTIALTAQRIGEVLGGRWQDVEYTEDGIYLNVTHQWTKRKQRDAEGNVILGKNGKPKEEFFLKGVRKNRVSLRIRLHPSLAQWYGREARMAARWKADTDFIFPGARRDKPVDPNNIRRTMRTLAKKLGLASFAPHDWRHTIASHMIRNGVPLAVVADTLGDTIQTIERVYAHEIRSAQERTDEAADALAAVVNL
jgi:integrase